jgi:HD-GYP domain-containing protein (c-di-GMP phosphodiesterase class II)
MDYCWLEPERQAHSGTPATHDFLPDAVTLGWARALDARSQLPEGFTGRVAALAVQIGATFELRDKALRHLYTGALLHDIGMMHVPDSIMRKPGPLTPGEWAMIRLHPLFADEILAPIDTLHTVLPIPRYHHERWDGSGYPYELRGEQIPLPARIFTVACAWMTMTVDRPYRRALPPEVALLQIEAATGTAYDPEVVGRLLSLVDRRAHTA